MSVGRGRARSIAGAQERAAGSRQAERQRGERRAGGERHRAGAAGRAGAHAGQAVRGRRCPASASSVPSCGRAARRAPGDEVRGDDRARRGADEVLALAQVEPGGVLDPGQHAHHPRLAEHAAAAEDEDVGAGEHRRDGRRRRTCTYVITYGPYGDDARCMTTPSDPLGPRIKALREAGGLSLRDLAERSGVSAPMLSQVERGETSPTLQVAAQDRRRARAAPLPAAAPRRGRRGHRRAPARAAPGPGRATGHALRDPHPAAARPARRALAPHAGARRGHRRPRRPADARARQPRDRARAERARSSSTATAIATRCIAGDAVTFDADLPHHFENHGPDEAVLLAVVSAGLRRS